MHVRKVLDIVDTVSRGLQFGIVFFETLGGIAALEAECAQPSRLQSHVRQEAFV